MKKPRKRKAKKVQAVNVLAASLTAPVMASAEPAGHQAFAFSEEHMAGINRSVAALQAGLKKYAGHKDLYQLQYDLSLVLLSVGRFEEGWPMFESRFALPGAKYSYDHFPVERYDGGSLRDKHIFVWLEQGIGDQIMGASMLAELQAAVGDAGSITVIADRFLVPVLRRSFPKIHFHKTGEPISRRKEEWDYDYQLCYADLGAMFRTTAEQFPGTPFLIPDPDKVAIFKRDYARLGAKPVGFAWCSNSDTTGGDKSTSLEEMQPILRQGEYAFVNMQYGDHEYELADAGRHGLRIFTDDRVDQLIDLDTFFAQVAAVEFIVTTSQSLAHIAGSMGVKTYVLMPRGKGRLWYWFAEMSQSPWYNSVQIFRQEKPGDWSVPIQAVADKISCVACLLDYSKLINFDPFKYSKEGSLCLTG